MLLAEHGPMSQSQLAHGAGCEPPSVTLMVRKLESGGLVERQRSKSDARAMIVTLTGEGRSLIAPLKKAWTQLAEETVAALDHPTDEVIDILQQLAFSLQHARAATRD